MPGLLLQPEWPCRTCAHSQFSAGNIRLRRPLFKPLSLRTAVPAFLRPPHQSDHTSIWTLRERKPCASSVPHATLDVAGTVSVPSSRSLEEECDAIVLDVGGMKCGGCSAAVKRILSGAPGVQSASVNLVTESAVVQLSPGLSQQDGPSAKKVVDLLTAKGFPSSIRSREDGMGGSADAAQQRKEAELRRSLLDLGVAWALVMICCTHHLGHLLHNLGWHSIAHTPLMTFTSKPLVSACLGAFALLGPGRPLVADGALSLFRGNPNMNSLVGMGAVTSFAAGAASNLLPGAGFDVSFLEEPVMLLAFVLLGRTLESRARLRATADLQSLARLIPATSRLLIPPQGNSKDQAVGTMAEVVMVPSASVRRGDVVRVLPGERIPVDGMVLDGQCSVDESTLTGESERVPKSTGSKVSAGTVSYSAPVTVRATSTGRDSTLAGIARLVAEAQSREVPLQRVADTVAGRFCYGVMATAALTFAFWSLVAPPLLPGWLAAFGSSSSSTTLLALKLAVDVLVVACPCALGLAAPTALLVASSLGAQRGLLLRGGDALERLASINTVALDKTGTITTGKLTMTDAHPRPGVSEAHLLRLAAAVESGTRHPIADAVLACVRERGLDIPEGQDARSQPGSGACCTIDGKAVAVGQLEWVQQCIGDSQGPFQMTFGRHLIPQESRTVVWVGVQGIGLLGWMSFSDIVRPDAKDVVRSLQRMGIGVLLLSGDAQNVVSRIAAEVGIPQNKSFGGLTPAAKASRLEALRSSGARVAMVGDGVNDTPALAAADVGVAMGGGVDAAGQAAGIVLLGDRLGQVVEAVHLARAALAKIRANLAWALVYNVAALPLAAGALLPSFGIALPPSTAGGMMAFSSLAVVTNSLSLHSEFARQYPSAQRKRQPGDKALHTGSRVQPSTN